MPKYLVQLAIALLLLNFSLSSGETWTYNDRIAHFERELPKARQLLENNPDSVEALNTLGLCLIGLEKDYPEAHRVLERSYELRPTQATAIYLTNSKVTKNSRERVEWALKALSYPTPSLHALEAFDEAIDWDPKLGLEQFENRDTARVRTHRKRWRRYLSRYERFLPAVNMVTQASSRSHLGPLKLPSSDLKFQVQAQTLTASSPQGQKLWSAKLSTDEVKLVSQVGRLFVIDPTRVRILDSATGKKLHEWPSQVNIPCDNYVWNVWEYPDNIYGADAEMLFVQMGNWFCVLRQTDASGWSQYFTHRLKTKVSEDREVIISEENSAYIKARDFKNGRLLWSYFPRVETSTKLLDVTPSEVFIELPEFGQLVVLSRKTGRVLRRVSHLNY